MATAGYQMSFWGGFKVVLIGVVVEFLRRRRRSSRSLAWDKMLQLYDAKVQEDFADCEHKQISTSFGMTQVHVSGSRADPPVLLFHGVRATSLQFDFLVKPLAKRHCVIAVDYICDVGRSLATKAPTSDEDHAQWFLELAEGLGLPSEKGLTLVGFSYGSFLAASIALKIPDRIERLVLISPAATVAPITSAFLKRIIAGALLAPLGFDFVWTWEWLTAPTFSVRDMKDNTNKLDLFEAIHNAVPEWDLSIPPRELSGEELKKLASVCPVTLMMPEFETVVQPELAIKNANEAGISVVEIPRAGHVACIERPEWLADAVTKIVAGDKTDTKI
eukprot:TRINITY_DN71624_c0_g1_i1.p1 TRINITY_DN71624_c0_g1~~TRINITY_DN71624_c0_g1_i1.p1  ORF type:complete len:332 (+),score=42.31 TRINITY_DN71624_c0_g1_i1:62-1057(+)